MNELLYVSVNGKTSSLDVICRLSCNSSYVFVNLPQENEP